MKSVATIVDRLFDPTTFADGHSSAVVVQQGNKTLLERYGADADADTPLISWSMAKTITAALVGLAVVDGLVELDAAAPIPEWTDDARHAITPRHLLQMRSGLGFVEDYVDAGSSDCLEMLFGDGQHDVAGYAIARELIHLPGTFWNYSSGETNIICRILRDALGGPNEFQTWAKGRLIEPLAMTSMTLQTDRAGTFVGSSYAYATARDFARFGRFLLDGGSVDGSPLLADGYVAEMIRPQANDPETGQGYGLQTWTTPDGRGTFSCNGYEGQYILCVPSIDAVIVHLGKVPADQRPVLRSLLENIVEALAT